MAPPPGSSDNAQPTASINAPTNYKIEDVTITVTRNSGALKTSPHRLVVSGAGASTLDRAGQKTALGYTPKDIVALLNGLYRVRFTELPSRYDVKYSVVQLNDGSLSVSALQMHDAATTSICLNIASYKKCLTIGSDAPTDLEAFVQRAFADADKFAVRKPGT